MHEFTTERRIEFSDTDMGGIVHFARYVIFMETAEHLFLESIGTSVVTEQEGQQVGWPRVAVRCDYVSPARFGDVLEIRVRVARKGRTSMTYRFDFSVGDRPVARGEMTSVCCILEKTGPRPIPIPEPVASALVPGDGESR